MIKEITDAEFESAKASGLNILLFYKEKCPYTGSAVEGRGPDCQTRLASAWTSVSAGWISAVF